ncbi:macrolide family glycosyltransferase [Streptomyces formicae]|uniref:Macrolide glycosyltransferase n=1 Tax=Streptomyces formicae TaxID=1616117 RepID=A0A291Q742_9ACTN|nr:macrolide family glycosyltransferase [Streptomyces formicae]ATL27336.1 Macrolide glycosyltransferase [Streptomyces formicae]
MSGEGRGAHIAFFSLPGSGHVNPTLGVVEELVARGHRVSFAVTERFAGAVEEAGARLVPYESTMDGLPAKDDPADRAERFGSDDLVRVLHDLLRETLAVLGPLDRFCAEDRPDLIVYDDPSGWGARIVAARRGIPALPYRTTFAAGEEWSLAEHHTDVDVSDPEIVRIYRGIAKLLARVGVRLQPQQLMSGSDKGPALVFVPRDFQYRAETFGDDFHFVGPCLARRASEGGWHRAGRPDAQRPLVLVSLGTIHNGDLSFYQRCVDAFADAEWDVVMAVGDQVDVDRLVGVPAHVEVRRHVPQLQVLREADLFVTHAGMGSVMEALSFGVPMVTVPQMAEQRANADRVVELGAGVLLHRNDVSAASLRAAARSVLDDAGFAERAGALRERVERSGGAGAAVDVIESLLAAEPAGGAESVGGAEPVGAAGAGTGAGR